MTAPTGLASLGLSHDGASLGLSHDGVSLGLSHDGVSLGLSHDGASLGLSHDGASLGLSHDGVRPASFMMSKAHLVLTSRCSKDPLLTLAGTTEKNRVDGFS